MHYSMSIPASELAKAYIQAMADIKRNRLNITLGSNITSHRAPIKNAPFNYAYNEIIRKGKSHELYIDKLDKDIDLVFRLSGQDKVSQIVDKRNLTKGVQERERSILERISFDSITLRGELRSLYRSTIQWLIADKKEKARKPIYMENIGKAYIPFDLRLSFLIQGIKPLYSNSKIPNGVYRIENGMIFPVYTK